MSIWQAEKSSFLQLTAGNLVTASSLWMMLNMAEGDALRRTHPLVRDALAAVPWHWQRTAAHIRSTTGARRFRATHPHAECEVRLNSSNAPHMIRELPPSITRFVLCDDGASDDAIAALHGLRELVLINKYGLFTDSVSFAHLSALKVLDCGNTNMGSAIVATLPTSLQELYMSQCWGKMDGMSFAHLPALRVLHCGYTTVGNAALATLPVSLYDLCIHSCWAVTADISFAHLPALTKLVCSYTAIDDTAIATLISVRILDISRGWGVIRSFAHLSLLEVLDCNNTDTDDALLMTIPPSLRVLCIDSCDRVSADVSFAHLPLLIKLECWDTTIGGICIID